jgi:hypothetical protein
MSNAQVKVFSDGVNLENCLKQGLTITGTARCPYCKQTFSYQLHLFKHTGNGNGGKKVARALKDTYDICIDFSADAARFGTENPLPQATDNTADEICVPCRGCSMHCPKLAKRYG